MSKKILEASRRPFTLATSPIAKRTPSGTQVPEEDVSVPYELIYTSKHHFSNNKEFDEDGNQVMWFDQLKRIKAGEIIYEVHALTAPDTPHPKFRTEYGGELVKIADIKLKTDMYTSEWGDNHLFFHHTDLARDMHHYWPEPWRHRDEDHYRR